MAAWSPGVTVTLPERLDEAVKLLDDKYKSKGETCNYKTFGIPTFIWGHLRLIFSCPSLVCDQNQHWKQVHVLSLETLFSRVFKFYYLLPISTIFVWMKNVFQNCKKWYLSLRIAYSAVALLPSTGIVITQHTIILEVKVLLPSWEKWFGRYTGW